MRLLKSLTAISAITFLALIYVHQQVELVKLSYAITYKEKKIKDMLDRKESLRYNIANLEDPARLEGVLLAKKIDISFPKKDHVFKVAQSTDRIRENEAPLRVAVLEGKGAMSGILEFFGFRAEAQAKEK